MQGCKRENQLRKRLIENEMASTKGEIEKSVSNGVIIDSNRDLFSRSTWRAIYQGCCAGSLVGQISSFASGHGRGSNRFGVGKLYRVHVCPTSVRQMCCRSLKIPYIHPGRHKLIYNDSHTKSLLNVLARRRTLALFALTSLVRLISVF